MENSAKPMQPEDELGSIWTKETQKPDEFFDQKYWKKIFISSCLCALLVDPLFLYIPILKDDIKCLMLDPKLKIAVLLLRSVTDLFYLIDIIIRIYRSENYSGLIDELNRRQHRMNLSFVLKSCVPRIAKTICASIDILIDIVALLPFPQVAILIFFSKMSDLIYVTKTRMVIMNVFALSQYVPRVLRIYLSFMELKRTPKEEITETPIWFKGVLNFSMYIIASHIFGAVWYLFAIQRMMWCWHFACRKDVGCDNRIFGCHDHHAFRNTTVLNDLCPLNSSDTVLFDFGIFATVLQYGIVGSTDYFQKFLNCFWWGLRNLSSLGSNLEPSSDGWENLYTIFISIIGLLLFLYLIGNLQMYMQFETTRTEDHKHRMQMRRKRKEKGQEIELLLFKNGTATRLIKDIKLRIMEKVQQGLDESMDTNWDNILPILPSDLQSLIKDARSLAWLKQVWMLQGMDKVVLKRIYQQLEPVKYAENSDIIQKGKPLENMLIIVDGLVSIEERSDDSKRGVVELFGEELLRWPFSTSFPKTKPLATESVKAIGAVEALSLKACDLESIYEQPEIEDKERPRHKTMIKEEMEKHIDWLMPRNGIPKSLNQRVKSRIMENLALDYWDILNLAWDDLVSRLSSDFQNTITSYMPLTTLKEVPLLRGMDEAVLKRICQQLKLVRYTENSDIIQKGKPLEEMLLIVDGHVSIEERSSGYSKRGAGKLCGEKLLLWPFCTSFLETKPSATESVKAIGAVEALSLKACDLESIYKQPEIEDKERPRHRTMIKEEMEKHIDWLMPRNGIPKSMNQRVKSWIMENLALDYWDILNLAWDDLVSRLSLDFQNTIKSYMPLTMLKEVPLLRSMDEAVLKRICQQLEPVRYTENNDIIQKGKPLEEMLLIVDGFVSIEERSSDDSKRVAGELCGEELLRWPFCTFFPERKPLATESVKAIGAVEALSLKACDLEIIYKEPFIKRDEELRHRRMMKEKIDRLITIYGIPRWLKSQIMKKVEADEAVYWNTLPFDRDSLVSLLPFGYQDEIQNFKAILTKLKEMPAFQNMDESVLKEICHHFQPKKYRNTAANIIKKGDPIQMLFIVKGRIGHGGRIKGAGEFYGEGLLDWPFSIVFPDELPTAADTPKAKTVDVEALVLTTSDMKIVGTEFRKHFIKNYGRLVLNLVKYVSPVSTPLAPSSSEAVVKFFTEEELKEATRNFSDDYCVNEERYGTVYRAELDGRYVAIKRCNTTRDQYIKSQGLVQEAFVLSQIRHENVVRLLGCCLESKWPIMVYDGTYFPTFDGAYFPTLIDHIRSDNFDFSLELRMKIAAETARALKYLHSMSVIHQDVKTANILINRTYTARVSGFGASRLLHEDDLSAGPLGYLDPENHKSNVPTEKNDVYSFGVVLVELLTRQEADEPEGSLTNFFVCSVQKDCLGQILDGKVIKDEYTFEIAKKVSELAMTCLRSSGEERPSMDKVAAELEGIVQMLSSV